MKVSKTPLIVSIFLIGIMSYAQNSADEESRTFNLIDVDKNEIVTIREMINFYKAQTDENGEAINAKKLFYGLDANKNSIITLDEYIQGVDWQLAEEFVNKWGKNAEKKEEFDSQKILTEKFTKIDVDKNEELSLNEVMNFYKNKMSKTTGNPIDGKLNFYAYDTNEDGKIPLEEFLKKPNWKVAALRLQNDEVEVQIEEELYSNDEVDLEDNVNLSEIDSVSDEHLNKQIAMFNKADKDENFKLTIEEFINYYEGKTDKAGNAVNAELNFYGLDKDGDGFVNLVEFTTKIDWELASKKYESRRQ
ncbi:hypothetical protein [Winogradskyella sp. R77965]|uniref:hypothetical protein n=1 Tax=Winogradskyella sp. R77965 TaxID=3093872 RepID=UPI0037DDA2F8